MTTLPHVRKDKKKILGVVCQCASRVVTDGKAAFWSLSRPTECKRRSCKLQEVDLQPVTHFPNEEARSVYLITLKLC